MDIGYASPVDVWTTNLASLYMQLLFSVSSGVVETRTKPLGLSLFYLFFSWFLFMGFQCYGMYTCLFRACCFTLCEPWCRHWPRGINSNKQISTDSCFTLHFLEYHFHPSLHDLPPEGRQICVIGRGDNLPQGEVTNIKPAWKCLGPTEADVVFTIIQ